MSWFSKLVGAASTIGSFIPGVGPVAGTALGAIGNIADSITAEDSIDKQNKFNATQAQLNRDFQREERLATQEYNREMWNMQNEYNLPINQMQRLTDAGLNPNDAISALGGSTAGSVPASSPMSGSTASSVGALGSSLLAQSQAQLIAQAQLSNLEADTANKSYELTWNKLSEPERLDNIRQNNRKLSADVDKITRDIQHIDFDENMQNNYYSWFCAKSEEEISIMHEQLNLLRNQSFEVLSNIRKNDAQTNLINEQAEGQDLSNQLQTIAVEFSNVTGIPIGTPLHDVAFSLWQSGKFEELNRYISSYALGESIHQDLPSRAISVAAFYDLYNRDMNASARDSFRQRVAEDMFHMPHLFRVPNYATEIQRYWDSLPDMPRNVRVRLPSIE